MQVNHRERAVPLVLSGEHRGRDGNAAPEARAGSLSPHPAQGCVPD